MQRLDRVPRSTGAALSVDTPQGVYKIKGAFADVHKTNFFKGYSPTEEANTSKPKPTMKLKDWMCIADTGGDGRKFSYLTRRESIWKTRTLLGEFKQRAVSSVPRGEGLHPGAQHLLIREGWWKILLRYCLGNDYARSWVALTWSFQETIPNKRKVRRLSQAALTTLFLSSRSRSKRLFHYWVQHQPDTTPPGEILCHEKKRRRQPNSERMIDDDAAPPRTSSLADEERQIILQRHHLPRL